MITTCTAATPEPGQDAGLAAIHRHAIVKLAGPGPNLQALRNMDVCRTPPAGCPGRPFRRKCRSDNGRVRPEATSSTGAATWVTMLFLCFPTVSWGAGDIGTIMVDGAVGLAAALAAGVVKPCPPDYVGIPIGSGAITKWACRPCNLGWCSPGGQPARVQCSPCKAAPSAPQAGVHGR
jgi:hypothetical protein